MCDRNQGSFFFSRHMRNLLYDYDSLLYWVKHILLRTPSIWFLVDCNARSALFITPGRICCKGNPENQAQCDRSLLYLLLVASLRFSLVYLCVQFAFSAAALHFLVRWISRLIALWSKGVYIPSLHFFCENNPEPWPVFFFVHWQIKSEDLFFYNDHGILYVWK